jgi:hypothetical protein
MAQWISYRSPPDFWRWVLGKMDAEHPAKWAVIASHPLASCFFAFFSVTTNGTG